MWLWMVSADGTDLWGSGERKKIIIFLSPVAPLNLLAEYWTDVIHKTKLPLTILGTLVYSRVRMYAKNIEYQ